MLFIPTSQNLLLPPDFGSIFGWFNFNYLNTVTTSSGLISQIAPITGSAVNFTSSGSQRPTLNLSAFNGKAMAAFTSSSSTQLVGGTADYFGSTGMTIFIFGTAPAQNNQGWLAKQGSSTTAFYIERDTTLNNVRCFLTNSALSNTAVAANPFTDGAYNIITLSFSNATNTISLYRNGVVRNTGTLASPLLSLSTTTLYLGSRGPSGSTYFNGQIGEVIMYNQILNQTAISGVVNYMRSYWGYWST